MYGLDFLAFLYVFAFLASRPYTSPASHARPEIHPTSLTQVYLKFDRVVSTFK
jgi:hypothetical protein